MDIEELKRTVQEISDRQTQMERQLKENTETTHKVAANTAVIVEWTEAMAGAMKVLEALGKLAKPLSYLFAVGTAIAMSWGFVKALVKSWVA